MHCADSQRLRGNTELDELTISGNPISRRPNCTIRILSLLPWLQLLDSKQISTEDRLKAAVCFSVALHSDETIAICCARWPSGVCTVAYACKQDSYEATNSHDEPVVDSY